MGLGIFSDRKIVKGWRGDIKMEECVMRDNYNSLSLKMETNRRIYSYTKLKSNVSQCY